MAYMVMLSDYYFPLRGSGSILMLAVALGIFFFFYRLKIDHNGAINWLAKGTFAAYLIHDYGPIRQILWIKVLKCNEWFCSPSFILHGILTIVGILLVGAISTVFLDKIVCSLLDIPIVKKIIKKLDWAYQIDKL